MHYLFVVTVGAFSCLSVVLGQVSLLDHLKYYATENQYAAQVYPKLEILFFLENVLGSSLEVAMEFCQNSFKWDRWNCPNSDFISRRASQSLLLDPEDSYVNAITMAAVLYTITKNCSSGIIAGCNGSCFDNLYSTQCWDDPKAAKQLLKKHVNLDFSDDFYGKISKNNYEAVTNLLNSSLVQRCDCAILSSNGLCAKEICRQVLKPFKDIADEIRQMYDKSLQLNKSSENLLILWENLPLDA